MNLLISAALLFPACQDTAVGIYNTPPSATITQPGDAAIFAPDELIEFRGVVQDGQQTPDELSVFWTSSVDGELGSSQADTDGVVFLPVTDLSSGTHAITLTAIDEEGKTGEETIAVDISFAQGSEGEPTLVIVGPIEGEIYTQSMAVTVVATATDAEQPSQTLNATIISSRDGTLWTGTPASNGAITEDFSGLSVGPHNLTVTIEDADGHVVADGVNIEVDEDGSPDVAIIAPAADSSWWTTDTLTFEGLVGDDLTDAADLLVEWDSNIDGVLYTGSPDSSGYTAFGGGLTEGVHALTLTATDEDFNASSEAITVTIIDPLNYDNDGDGYTELEDDCDDGDPTAYPGAPEACDELDNDCNGLTNEDWWDTYDATTGADNDSFAAAYNLGEVDSSWLWNGDYLEVAGLSIHEPLDEDWFKFDVDDDYYDNANFSVKITSLYASATWVIELYDDGGRLEDSQSGNGSLTVSFDGDWLDDDEDIWYIRVYTASWPGGGICDSYYTIQINA